VVLPRVFQPKFIIFILLLSMVDTARSLEADIPETPQVTRAAEEQVAYYSI
jgi:hypothetical protein